MMILDEPNINVIVQAAADWSNVPQELFKRKDGSYIYCPKGSFQMMRSILGPNEQLSYVGIVNPSSWPKEDKNANTSAKV